MANIDTVRAEIAIALNELRLDIADIQSHIEDCTLADEIEEVVEEHLQELTQRKEEFRLLVAARDALAGIGVSRG